MELTMRGMALRNAKTLASLMTDREVELLGSPSTPYEFYE
jgi:hypothetical protein